MKQLYTNNSIWLIHAKATRNQLILAQFRFSLKISSRINSYDRILGKFLSNEISSLFRDQSNQTNIAQIQSFLDSNYYRNNVLQDILNDFEQRTRSPSTETIRAVRCAYNQSGIKKMNYVRKEFQSEKNQRKLQRQIIAENILYNIPVTQEMRDQLLENSVKYSSIYKTLFDPDFDDFLFPNMPFFKDI